MRWITWVGAALTLAACGSDAGAGQGALGSAAIAPTCGAGDTGCLSAGFGAPIGVGAEMTAVIKLDIAGSATPTLVLTSVNPSVLEVVDGRRLRGVQTGMSALLVQGPGGDVIDFVHVFVRPSTELLLRRLGPAGPEAEPLPAQFQLLVGDDFQIEAQEMAGVQPLLGVQPTTWTLSAPGILELLDPGTVGRRRLVARGPGTVQMTVASATQSAAITMEVRP